jgi:hypothetical protein
MIQREFPEETPKWNLASNSAHSGALTEAWVPALFVKSAYNRVQLHIVGIANLRKLLGRLRPYDC